MHGDTIPGIGAASSVPELSASCDYGKLSLSRQEAFLLSRVDGLLDFEHLIAISGLPPAEAISTIQRLIGLGAIRVRGQVPTGDSTGSGDLDPEICRRIERMYALVEGRANWYDLLGVERGATDLTIKKAYRRLSREFHPDAFFSTRTGVWGDRIEAVYQALRAGHDTLLDPRRRIEYDRALAHRASGAGPASPEQQAQERARQERREQEAARRRQRRNPLVLRLEKARSFYDEGRRLTEESRWVQAAAAFQSAAALDPRNTLYRQVAREANVRATAQRAKERHPDRPPDREE